MAVQKMINVNELFVELPHGLFWKTQIRTIWQDTDLLTPRDISTVSLLSSTALLPSGLLHFSLLVNPSSLSLHSTILFLFALTPSISQLIKLPYILLIMSIYADKWLDEKI